MSAPPMAEPTKICMGCGRSINASFVACPYCGAQAQQQQQYAPQPQQQVVYAQPAPQPQVIMGPAQPMQATRTCLGCGLQIPINYNVCPHCGKPVGVGGGQEMGAIRYLLYLLSIFWLLGIIIGLVLMSSSEPDKKRVGKNCLYIGIIMLVIEIVLCLVWWLVIGALAFGLM